MAAKDKELEAISSIIDLLKPLGTVARSRVLEYVLKRLDMEAWRRARVTRSPSRDTELSRS